MAATVTVEDLWGLGHNNICTYHQNNTRLCDPMDGSCQCRAGYSYCSYMNDAVCDPVTGQCLCGPGWRGEQCEVRYLEGKHGNDCAQDCLCHNGAECNAVSRKCSCL